MEFQSRFDPSRETVGKIYRDLQVNGYNSPVECGDMARELTSSLITDINETIGSNPHDGKDFYILIHEKKDLAMPRAIRRDIYTMVYRPYPEDDTLVFRIQHGEAVKFCWCLPHSSEMQNILNNANLYEDEMVEEIRAFRNNDLTRFGFMKVGYGEKWAANPFYEDKPLFSYKNVKSKLIRA
jgi:hypothetical protein